MVWSQMTLTTRNTAIDYRSMPVEALAELANDAGAQVETHAKGAVRAAMVAGEALTAAKAQLAHGEWMAWLKANWDYSHQLANQYMQISNYQRASNLEDASSVREALRMIAAEKAEIEPKRKTDQVVVLPASGDDDNELGTVDDYPPGSFDPDPGELPPDPPFNKPSAEATKQPEAKRKKPPAVTPEIVEPSATEDPVEAWFRSHSLAQVLARCISDINDETTRKHAAAQLRKLANKLDPPKKFTPPTVDEVAAYCSTRGNRVDPEAFVSHYAANGWRLSNGNKLSDWQAAVITWEKRDKANGKQASSRVHEQDWSDYA